MTPLTGYVGYSLRRAQAVIFADFNQSLSELKLRPAQFAVLLMIDQNPGASQSGVSAALGIQKANFVAIIADLEKRGVGSPPQVRQRWTYLLLEPHAARPGTAGTCGGIAVSARSSGDGANRPGGTAAALEPAG